MPEECPLAVEALIAACVAEDPATRPSAKQLVAALAALPAPLVLGADGRLAPPAAAAAALPAASAGDVRFASGGAAPEQAARRGAPGPHDGGVGLDRVTVSMPLPRGGPPAGAGPWSDQGPGVRGRGAAPAAGGAAAEALAGSDAASASAPAGVLPLVPAADPTLFDTASPPRPAAAAAAPQAAAGVRDSGAAEGAAPGAAEAAHVRGDADNSQHATAHGNPLQTASAQPPSGKGAGALPAGGRKPSSPGVAAAAATAAAVATATHDDGQQGVQPDSAGTGAPAGASAPPPASSPAPDPAAATGGAMGQAAAPRRQPPQRIVSLFAAPAGPCGEPDTGALGDDAAHALPVMQAPQEPGSGPPCGPGQAAGHAQRMPRPVASPFAAHAEPCGAQGNGLPTRGAPGAAALDVNSGGESAAAPVAPRKRQPPPRIVSPFAESAEPCGLQDDGLPAGGAPDAPALSAPQAASGGGALAAAPAAPRKRQLPPCIVSPFAAPAEPFGVPDGVAYTADGASGAPAVPASQRAVGGGTAAEARAAPARRQPPRCIVSPFAAAGAEGPDVGQETGGAGRSSGVEMAAGQADASSLHGDAEGVDGQAAASQNGTHAAARADHIAQSAPEAAAQPQPGGAPAGAVCRPAEACSGAARAGGLCLVGQGMGCGNGRPAAAPGMAQAAGGPGAAQPMQGPPAAEGAKAPRRALVSPRSPFAT